MCIGSTDRLEHLRSRYSYLTNVIGRMTLQVLVSAVFATLSTAIASISAMPLLASVAALAAISLFTSIAAMTLFTSTASMSLLCSMIALATGVSLFAYIALLSSVIAMLTRISALMAWNLPSAHRDQVKQWKLGRVYLHSQIVDRHRALVLRHSHTLSLADSVGSGSLEDASGQSLHL